MSQAFVRESEEPWLHEVTPVLSALIAYLTRENNGVRVYEKRNYMDSKTGRQVHEMSNGLNYTKDNDGRWKIQW